MKNRSKILSLLLCAALILALLPGTVLAEEEERGLTETEFLDIGSDENDSVGLMASNLKICGVDIGIAPNTRMNFNASKDSTAYVDNGYYYKGVYLAASQCFGFARWCQYKIYGAISAGNYDNKYTSGSKKDFYRVNVDGKSSVAAGSLTTSNLKSFIKAAKPGAHLRTNGSAHSMIITAITDKGFSIAQANGSNNDEYSGYKKNYVGTHTYTWSSYVSSTYGSRGIAYIEVAYKASSKPDAPKIAKTETISDTELKVSWNKVSGASYYRVERRRGDGTEADYKTVCKKVTGTSYKDSGLSSGSRYWYRVYAVNADGVESAHSIDTNDNHGAWTKIKRPSASVDNDHTNYVNLKWPKSYGTHTYTFTVYRADPSNGTYSSFKAVKSGIKNPASGSVEFTDKTASQSKVYKYYVETVYNNGTCTKSDTFYAGSKYNAKPTLTATSLSSIRINWDNPTNGGCSFKYTLKKLEVGKSDYEDITVSGKQYEDKNLTPGKTYKYYIQYRDSSNNFITSSFSNSLTLDTSYAINISDTVTVEAGVPTDIPFTFKGIGIQSMTSQRTNDITDVKLSNIVWKEGKGTVTVTASKDGKIAIVLYDANKDILCRKEIAVKVNHKTYTVNFDANGGTTPIVRKTVTVGSTYGELPVPNYSGYLFDGWYTEKTGGVKITSDSKVNLNADQTLYAHWGNVSVDLLLRSLSVDKEKATLKIGESIQLTALATSITTPLGADPFPINFGEWSSSDDSVASVKNGKVIAIGAGTTTITVAASKLKATSTITVLPAEVSVTGVTLSSTSAELEVGETLKLIATVNPTNATNKSITWKTDNYNIATVENGTVKAVAPGKTVISVITNDGNKKASCNITVKAPSDPGTANLVVGSVSGSAGEQVTLPVSIKNNPGIATINLIFKYDKALLTPVSITKNEILSDGIFTSNIQQGGDLSRFEFVSASWTNPANMIGNGDILYLVFKISDSAPEGDIPITAVYSDGDIADQNYNSVKLNITNGKISVKNNIIGDVFNDGTVNGKDAVRLSQYLAKWEISLTPYEMVAADIIKDGAINGKDAVKLSQYLAKWDVALQTVKTMGNGNLNLEVGQAVNNGRYVDVPVNITENTGAAVIILNMNYDKSKLIPVSAKKGEILSDGSFTTNLQQGGDLSRFDFVSLNWTNAANNTETGTAFTVRFELKDTNPGIIPITISYEEGNISDQLYDSLDVNITNGMIVIPPAVAAEPSLMIRTADGRTTLGLAFTAQAFGDMSGAGFEYGAYSADENGNYTLAPESMTDVPFDGAASKFRLCISGISNANSARIYAVRPYITVNDEKIYGETVTASLYGELVDSIIDGKGTSILPERLVAANSIIAYVKANRKDNSGDRFPGLDAATARLYNNGELVEKAKALGIDDGESSIVSDADLLSLESVQIEFVDTDISDTEITEDITVSHDLIPEL